MISLDRSSTRIIAAVFILLSVSAYSTSALEWYSSAVTGLPGRPISSGPSESGWSLSIEWEGEDERRALYLDGELQNQTVSYRSEGRLVAREELDAGGTTVSRVEYAYDAQGNPRTIYIGSEQIATQQAVSADSAGLKTAQGSDGDWVITELDDQRNPVAETTVSDGVETVRQSWKRDDKGVLLENTRISGQEESRTVYDSDGRLQEETVSRNGILVLSRTYYWSGSSLVKVVEDGQGSLIVRELTWNGEVLTAERRSVDGVTVSETVWNGIEDRTELLFRDGVPVIRVTWNGDSKIREEFLRDGEVIRVRESGS